MIRGLETAITDQDAYDRNVESLHSVGLVLPRISDLADPPAKLAAKMVEIADADPDVSDARNLFRVHWYNGTDRSSLVQVPEHVVLTEAITGPSLQRVFDHLNVDGDLNARAFVAATGSAGTLAAADHLKQSLGTQTGVIEAIANILGAIKYAKFHDLGAEDVVMTVATDGANMYQTELNIAQNIHFQMALGWFRPPKHSVKISLALGSTI